MFRKVEILVIQTRQNILTVSFCWSEWVKMSYAKIFSKNWETMFTNNPIKKILWPKHMFRVELHIRISSAFSNWLTSCSKQGKINFNRKNTFLTNNKWQTDWWTMRVALIAKKDIPNHNPAEPVSYGTAEETQHIHFFK